MQGLKHLIAIAALVFLAYTAVSQVYTPSYTDSITYSDFLKKDWKNLIKHSNAARRQKTDFFYLQYRTGIAYYEQKKYMNAVPYFETASISDPNNTVLAEYLYFSFLFSGRSKDAQRVASKLSEYQKQTLNISSPALISSVNIFSKYGKNENYSHLPEIQEVVEQQVVTDYRIDGIGLTFDNSDDYTVGAGLMQTLLNKDITALGVLTVPPIYGGTTKQTDYYVSVSRYLKKGFTLTGTYHGLRGNDVNYNSLIISKDTISNISFSAFWLGLTASKTFRSVTVGGTVALSNLNGFKIFEKNVYGIVYPLSNRNLYYSLSYGGNSVTDSSQTKNYSAFTHTLGFKFGKFLYLEPSFVHGERFLYSEYGGIVIDNEADVLINRLALQVSFNSVSQNFHVFARYEQNKKRNFYLINSEISSTDYINQTFTGGFLWYFQK